MFKKIPDRNLSGRRNVKLHVDIPEKSSSNVKIVENSNALSPDEA